MDSRVKYLDELILAIKTSRDEDSTDSRTFPPEPLIEDDTKSYKVITTLLRNLSLSAVPSNVFAKSLEALDLLVRSKPHLLISDAQASNNKGLVWLLKNFMEIACIHWESTHFKWVIKQKVAQWCKIFLDCSGFPAGSQLSTFFSTQLTKLEAQLTHVLSGTMDELNLSMACKKIHVLCDWCNTKALQSSILVLDTVSNSNKWDYTYQRLIRIVFYVLDAVAIDSCIVQDMQARFISQVVSYAIMRGSKYRHINRSFTTNGSFLFSLDLIRSFLRSHIDSWQLQNDVLFSKSLLRLYLVALTNDATFQAFFLTCYLDQWSQFFLESDYTNESLSDTKRALILIVYDFKRRTASNQDLEVRNGICTLKSNGYSKLFTVCLQSFDRSRQLDNLRKTILYEFQPKISKLWSKDLEDAELRSDQLAINAAFDELETKIEKNFKQGNLHFQSYAVRLLGKLSCVELLKGGASTEWQGCPICDSSLPSSQLELIDVNRPPASSKSRAFKILFDKFIQTDNMASYGESLWAAIAIALKRIFVHFQPPHLLSQRKEPQDTTSIFAFFKKLATTPNRYLRILSVGLISSWSFSSFHDLEDQHTTYLIGFLQESSIPSFTETTLMGWVRLTLATRGETFDPLLLKLIDIFNSTNFAERCMMAHQLRYVAWLKRKTPYLLLSPILPTLLKQIGKNLIEKKLSFQRLADFVEYPPKTILENFQRYIVPYAITQYKDDVITEICSLMCDYDSEELSGQKEKLLKKNSRQIFAVALVKHCFFSIDTLESLFVNCLPTFDRSYVAAYLPDYKTLAEVLKLFKNANDGLDSKNDNREMVLCSLRFLFTRFESDKRRASRLKLLSEWSNDQERQFQKRLQENILGVFQVFSSDMHDIEGRTTYFEKLRVINGIHFLIIHASSECLISSLAQISICLQTGQEVSEIEFNTFRCWLDLVKRLSQEQLSSIIDSFVPFVLQKWSSFRRKVQSIVHEILTILINEKTELILTSRPYVTLALVNMPELEVLEKNKSYARLVKRTLSTTNWFEEYANNLRSKNKHLIRQSLRDVRILLQQKQLDGLFQSDPSASSRAGIPLLLGSLLDTSYKFRTEDMELCRECTSIIGIIGVLDVTKFRLPRIAVHMRDVYDFSDHAQTVKFLISIIDNILVPAFWESENPTKQLFVALVMQESLKYCGLSSSSWDIQKPDLYPNEARLWDRFNDISKTTLYPLRSSLYMAQSWKEYTPIRYPSFDPKEGYKGWLKNLTLDLLKTGTEEGHPLHVFSSLIREDDGFLSENLLPYVVMDILIKAEEHSVYQGYVNNIKVEFVSIFEFDHSSLNHYQIDSIKMCYETVFKVLEYCKKWVTQFKQTYHKKYGTFIIREHKYLKMIERITEFLEMIPFGLMAQRSLETDSFERSALYLEQSYRSKDKGYYGNDKLLPYLQKTYAEIGDIDSVDGVLKVFSTGSVTSKIEELQYTHNWSMAQQCFEALGKIPEPTVKYKSLCSSGNTKMLKSMYNHQQYDQVIATMTLLDTENVDLCAEEGWLSMGMECAYLTGQYDVISEWVSRLESIEHLSDPIALLHYNFGKLLSSISQGDQEKALYYTERCHKLIGAKFSIPSASTTLLKMRDVILRLHAIRDLWLLSSPSLSFPAFGVNTSLDRRLENVGGDFEPRHFLLSIRKSYSLLKSEKSSDLALAEDFFRIAQNARINSRPDLASSALIHALISDYPSADLEYAEILWNQGENDKAIKLVAEIHEKIQNNSKLTPRERAKVYLKYTEWLDLSNNSISEQIIKQYNEVIKVDSAWSEPYYSLGLYFSRLLEKRSAEGYITNGRFENKSISFFLLAFEKDTTKVREALPKVVTFWLDTANLYVSETNTARKEVLKRSVEEQCKRVEMAIKNCPTYIWYAVITQLLSRLLHMHKTSMQLMMHILLNLTIEYPSHILWYVSILMNSVSSNRATIGGHIAEQFKQHSSSPRELLTYSDGLVKGLTQVCIKEVKSTSSRVGRTLDKDFNFNMKLAPCDMAVPVNANLGMLTPVSAESMSRFQPFRSVVSIVKFGSSYKVFSSLKKPKKLNVVGSDGKIYGIMCKKEDVRQDNQYMQFSTTMDFLLSKDFASRKRELGITTYAVMSLREDCGLIEIVPNVTTLRSILVTKYDSMKIKYSLKALHDKWQTLADDQKLGFFKDLLEKFPPVLYQWFLETFPDAIAWYKARNTFSRSYAVMAMVGHILGLGDRHCENILLDVETGKVLHVDFDCLFEKGKRLPIPEIVPFRLTHNLQDALGIAGTEGTFMKSSQVTLELMRANEVALMNIIETIMYDRNMDHSLQKALKVLRNKIRGIDSRDGLVLSVAGQVETVIQESTAEENLCKM